MSNLLKIVPAIQATSLIGKPNKSKVTAKDLVKQATNIIVGSSLIQSELNYI